MNDGATYGAAHKADGSFRHVIPIKIGSQTYIRDNVLEMIPKFWKIKDDVQRGWRAGLPF
jgi:hypothetical protein